MKNGKRHTSAQQTSKVAIAENEQRKKSLNESFLTIYEDDASRIFVT